MDKYLTAAGNQLVAETLAGGTITFTRLVMGDGIPAVDVVTEMVSPVLELPITRLKTAETQISAKTDFTNQSLKTGFLYRELGLYAKDSNDKEILFCYHHAGEYGEWIPPSDGKLIERVIGFTIAVDNADGITAVVQSEIYALDKDLTKAVEAQNMKNTALDDKDAEQADELTKHALHLLQLEQGIANIQTALTQHAGDIFGLGQGLAAANERIAQVKKEIKQNLDHIDALQKSHTALANQTEQNDKAMQTANAQILVHVEQIADLMERSIQNHQEIVETDTKIGQQVSALDTALRQEIETLRTQINSGKTTVENILTSASATNALSAAMGKQLQESKLDKTAGYAGSATAGGAATTALACTGNAATATKLAVAKSLAMSAAPDWDTLADGYYAVYGNAGSGSAAYNQPPGAYGWGSLLVLSSGQGRVQLYFAHGSGGNRGIWYRNGYSTGWGFGWSRIHDTANANIADIVSKITALQTGLDSKVGKNDLGKTFTTLYASGVVSAGAVTIALPKATRQKYMALKIFMHCSNSFEPRWYLPMAEIEFFNGKGEYLYEHVNGTFGLTVTDTHLKFHRHGASIYTMTIYGVI